MRLFPTIKPFRPASTNPPATTWKFFLWAVQGAWPGIIWATFWSACSGSMEAISATLLGDVIDVANTANPATVFSDHMWLFV
ncbi:MAG: ABC transporter ATP-binding protein, partial [Cypionkella sp.]|nr:ABC transporter ATP-binding protein [Cypionkella sp.]